MRDGTDDATFHRLFKPIMARIMEVFQPGAVVLQCGARPCLPMGSNARSGSAANPQNAVAARVTPPVAAVLQHVGRRVVLRRLVRRALASIRSWRTGWIASSLSLQGSMRGPDVPILARAGADSLAADRLGCFNLSLDGHAEAVRFMRVRRAHARHRRRALLPVAQSPSASACPLGLYPSQTS